ncbi:MAG TPA: malonyl-[acyl-carrier protein] O-methyltransferase BioC [Gammaproteobacteria bacterium]|nr:malonyl-[acyl-carrier protein] O-methyltransferase BioC [Gammaproteobacteria bacterium]
MNAEANPFTVDKRQARLSFERAAASYDDAAVLQREVGNRLAERLDYIRLSPRAVLDLGAGTGFLGGLLRRRYPRARILSLDFSIAMLRRARSGLPPLRRLLRRDAFLCADAEQLPLADASQDLVISNLTLQWCNELDRCFADIRRILRPGGLFMFTTFGPDTLRELRHSWRAVDSYNHVNAFLDMHDIGDALVHAGLADPVMDVERLTLTYAGVRDLMHDLKALGAHNATAGRARGLTGPAALRRMTAAYEAFRRPDGRLPATYEVIHGHCWAPLRRPDRGRPAETKVPVDHIGRHRP